MFDRFFEATKAQYIARPDASATELVYRHPDTTVPRGAKLTVRSDELAVFFREGRAVGILKPGAYQLDTQNIPFLGRLVNVATGGNHFIAEVFFVRTAETPIEIGFSELGSFVDVNSRNLLRLLFNARITVSASDPLALITQLGGQSSGSGSMIEGIVAARLRNALKAHVAREAEQVPIYRIVSNSSTETFGQAVVPAVGSEFGALGLKFVRFLDLHVSLDEESMALLRDYQRREADLTIDAKGAQVAADPGFAQYNAVKGARSVAEGLGSGLSQGFSGPVIGMGLGIPGGVLPGAGVGNPAVARPVSAPPARPATAPSGVRAPDRFIVEGPSGPEGPYTVRQVALWVLACGRSPESVRMRQEQDPSDLWSPVSAEPTVMAELHRRRAGATSASAVGAQGSAFEVAFAQAITDRRITADELSLLASLALTSRLAASEADARAFVVQRATAAGCAIDAPPGVSYAYWNGVTQEPQLTAASVADRIRAGGTGTHMVWTAELGNWVDARSVPAISALLMVGTVPPPPPPPPPPPSQA
jgi:membrane protease subunit (stomatin/prohibitin family)